MPAGERVPALSSASESLDEDAALEVLALGEIDVLGRLTDASNATLLVTVTHEGTDHLAVYKPAAGERPLWDFPGRTLARRETASYLLSRAAGWDVVPPTLLREDAPAGPGSLQWWIDAGSDSGGDPVPPEPGGGLVDLHRPGRLPAGWLGVLEAEDGRGRPVVLAHADDPLLRSMALFDAVANNADRKGGHVLAGRFQQPGHPRPAAADSRPPTDADDADADDPVVRGVDHGLTFHAEPKLRTVLWGWAGRRLPAEDAERLTDLAAVLDDESSPLSAGLAALLDAEELLALRSRLAGLRRAGRFPRPAPGRPPIPWPAF